MKEIAFQGEVCFTVLDDEGRTVDSRCDGVCRGSNQKPLDRDQVSSDQIFTSFVGVL